MPRSFPMDVFTAEVTEVLRLSQDFLRVRLAGTELTALAAPAGDGNGPVLDAYIKLVLPLRPQSEPVPLELTEDWRQDWFASTPEQRGGYLRTYTLRDARPWVSPEGERGVEIDVDFVLHEDPQDPSRTGPGSAWAAQAQAGQRLTLIGPTREGSLWTMWNPQGARSIVVSADETAVPAALSVLRTVPAQSGALFLLEAAVGNEDLVSCMPPEVRDREDVEVRWLWRSPEEGRGTPTLRALREAFGLEGRGDAEEIATMAREHPVTQEEVVWGVSSEPGETYVFLAGEASVVRSARRICTNEAEVPKANISFMGYWKEGLAES